MASIIIYYSQSNFFEIFIVNNYVLKKIAIGTFMNTIFLFFHALVQNVLALIKSLTIN